MHCHLVYWLRMRWGTCKFFIAHEVCLCVPCRNAICRLIAQGSMSWTVQCIVSDISLHITACHVPPVVSQSLAGVWRQCARNTIRTTSSARSVCSRSTAAHLRNNLRSHIAMRASKNCLVECRRCNWQQSYCRYTVLFVLSVCLIYMYCVVCTC